MPNPDIKVAFPPADMKLVADSSAGEVDALDGLADGMVGDMPACQKAFDIQVLQCSGAKTAQCLKGATGHGPAQGVCRSGQQQGRAPLQRLALGRRCGRFANRLWQLARLEAAGPDRGLPIIGMLGAARWPGVFSTPPAGGGQSAGAHQEPADYNFDTDAPGRFCHGREVPPESAMQFMTPPNATDLSPRRGRQMIVYHGNSDPVFSVNDTINWYEALNRKPWRQAAATSARLFTVPGLNHRQGGPATEQFDMQTALVNLAERAGARQCAGHRPAWRQPDVPATWQSNGTPRSQFAVPLAPTGTLQGHGRHQCR